MEKYLKRLIFKVTYHLCKTNQKTTPQEIKDTLIKETPYFYWTKNFIKETIEKDNFYFNIETFGIFPVYSLKDKEKNIIELSSKQLKKLILENKGKFLTVVHVKQTGELNLMNCQVLKSTYLGTIQVKEKGQYKQFYPEDLTEVRTKGNIYILK